MMCLMRRMLILIAGLACQLPLIHTHPLAQPSSVLQWEDVERLIDSHPAFDAARGQIGIAEGELRTSKQLSNPELGFSVGESEEFEGAGRRSIWDLEITIPLQWPGTYIYRIKAARSGVEAARFEASATRLDVYRELRGLYLAIAGDQEKLRLMRESESQLIELTEIARLRVEKGEARPLELTRMEGELEDLRLEIERSMAESQARRNQMSLWLGGKLPSEFTVSVDCANLPAPPQLSDALLLASNNSPVIMAAQSRWMQKRHAVTADKHSIAPDLGIGAFYGEEFDTRNYGGLITLTVPLWNWNRGSIARAEAEARRATAEHDLIEKHIRSAVIEEHARAESALAAVRRYQTSILPRAGRALADLETLYQTGECGLIDVLDARRALVRAQIGLNALQFDYLNAILEITVLTGGSYRA